MPIFVTPCILPSHTGFKNIFIKREKRQSQWTVKEKPILIKKIKEQGSGDASLLLDPEIRKTEDQIKDLITFHKKGNRLKEVPRVNPKSQR